MTDQKLPCLPSAMPLLMFDTNLEYINLSLNGFVLCESFLHAVFGVQLRVLALINISAQIMTE